MSARGSSSSDFLERFQAKACPGLDPGWKPVRVKKTRQIKNLARLRLRTDEACGFCGSDRRFMTSSGKTSLNRLLRPGLAAALPHLRAVDAPLKRAFDKINTQVQAWIDQAQFAA